MAKTTKSKPNQKSQTKVTRITASEKGIKPKKPSVLEVAKEVAANKTAKSAKSSSKKAKTTEKKSRKSGKNPIAKFFGYFKGAWEEIKQVRWPDRRSTWGLVGALILFTLALFVVIILLDYGFAWMFKIIMGKN